MTIVELRVSRLGVRQIAERIGRSPSTVSRELRRNSATGGDYRPFDAHRLATARRGRRHARRLETNTELRQITLEMLHQRWIPQQISQQLRLRFPANPGMYLCHETIYQALYLPGSAFLRPSRLAPYRRSPLRSPACASERGAAASTVSTADAHNSPASARTGGPF